MLPPHSRTLSPGHLGQRIAFIPGVCLRHRGRNCARMKYPSTITLFMEPLPPSRRPSAFVVSAVTHVVVITAAALGVFHVPTIAVRYPKERFTLRMIKLQNADDQK